MCPQTPFAEPAGCLAAHSAPPGSTPLEPPALGTEPQDRSWRGQLDESGWEWLVPGCSHTHPASPIYSSPFRGARACSCAHTHTHTHTPTDLQRAARLPGLRLPFLLPAPALPKPAAVVLHSGRVGVRGALPPRPSPGSVHTLAPRGRAARPGDPQLPREVVAAAGDLCTVVSCFMMARGSKARAKQGGPPREWGWR